ncbi:uncharacterized protein [Malus domestica]|uniref:uncharacterized protein n=1 Tax=Malus domestica TaxID=3750 RepID=UPI003976BCFA
MINSGELVWFLEADKKMKQRTQKSGECESSDTKSSASFEQKISPRHDLAMLFTCTVCETRSMKTCSRESYEKGVVVACCGGCNNLHLIADHLGYFGKPSNVEQFLAARGEEVKKGSADTLNLTLEDIAGIKPQG